MKTTTFALAFALFGLAFIAAPADDLSLAGTASAVGCEPSLDNLEGYLACETGRCDFSDAAEGRVNCHL